MSEKEDQNFDGSNENKSDKIESDKIESDKIESDKNDSKPIENQNLSKKIAKGSMFFGIAGSLNQIVALLILLISVRVLTVNEYGLYQEVNAYYLFAMSFFFFSWFRNIVIKYIGRNLNDRKQINSMMSGLLLFSFLGSTFFILIFFLFFEFKVFFRPELLLPLFIISFTITESMAEINTIFIGLQKYKLFNYTIMFKSLFLITFSMLFLFLFKYYTNIPPYYGLMLGSIIQNFGSLTFNYILIKKHYGNFLTRHIKFRKIFFESAFYGFNGFLAGSLYQLDIIILGNFYSTNANYDVVANFSNIQKTGINATKIIGILLGNMVVSILSPLIANNEIKKAEKASGKLIKISFYIVSIVMLVIATFPNVVVQILYGDEYLGISSLLYFSFFIIYFSITYGILDALFLAISKIRFLYIINIVKTVLLVIISLIIVPKYGLMGMLITVAISLTISLFVAIILSVKGAKINILKYIYKIFILGTIILGIAVFISNTFPLIFWQRIALFCVIFIIYNILIIYLGIITTDDLNIVKNIFKGSRFEKMVNKGLKLVEKLPIHEEK